MYFENCDNKLSLFYCVFFLNICNFFLIKSFEKIYKGIFCKFDELRYKFFIIFGFFVFSEFMVVLVLAK